MSGTYTDFTLDDGYFHTGVFEGVSQNLQVFNDLSQGAITLTDMRVPGHYHHKLGYRSLEDAWTRRDITSAAAIASGDRRKVTEFDQRGVKVNAKMFLEQTLDSFQKNFDPQMKGDYAAISQRIGQATGVGRLRQQVNHSLMAVSAALRNSAASANQHSATVSSGNYNGQMNSGDLIEGFAKLGDAAGNVRVWVMHSIPFFRLLKNQVLDKLTGVSDFALYQATPATLGKPVLVVDSAALVNVVPGSQGYTQYFTLGLVEGAVNVTVSEAERMVVRPVTGHENLEMHIQGEGAHNLDVKGAAWDVQNGGLNPTDAALATTTNWDTNGVHYKQRAGVVITTR